MKSEKENRKLIGQLVDAMKNQQEDIRFLRKCIEKISLNLANHKTIIMDLSKQVGLTANVLEEIKKNEDLYKVLNDEKRKRDT